MTIREFQKKITDALNGVEALVQGGCKAFAEDTMSIGFEIAECLNVGGVSVVVVTPRLQRNGDRAGTIPMECTLAVQCSEKPALNVVKGSRIRPYDNETVLNEAYETWVKADSASQKVGHLTPHGIGWTLEYIEFLCAEYGWSFREALDTPVATAYALEVACRQRHGGRHAGLDYIERQYRKDLKSGKAKARFVK